MYSVVLDYRLRPKLKALDQAHLFVMQKMQQSLVQCKVQVEFQGTCDLTVDGRKFSGNSLRCQRNSFLYHGTLLYSFDLDLLQNCLETPPRQPDYRDGRSHRDFVTNLRVSKEVLVDAIFEAWEAPNVFGTVDLPEVTRIAADKYSSEAWTHKR